MIDAPVRPEKGDDSAEWTEHLMKYAAKRKMV